MRIGWMVLLLWSLSATAGIDIDGQLIESEWQAATRFGDFLTADPLSLEPPAFRTEARVLAQPEGLYLAVIAQAPRSLRTYGQSPRDAKVLDADSVRIVVDFEGRGQSAYEFTVSLSNSHRDGIFLDQTRVSYDWDGAWYHAVSEDEENWYLEVFLPWGLAPVPRESGETRPIGIWFLRSIKALNRGFAYPAIEAARPTFVTDLHRMQVQSYSVQQFDWFPYAAASRDMLTDESKGRAGLDVFWKPDAQRQLSLTLNPDFAQVETDDLVVNFTAIETFFTEKRPFFTEGQSLFDLRLTNEGRLINTRRIGAAPDAGPEGITDILGALKFTGLSGRTEYGAFAAVEDDSTFADGRSFAAARMRYKFEEAALGYLGTYTRRPTLERDAQVHVVDANWTGHAGFSLSGQLIGTVVDQGDTPFVLNPTSTPGGDGLGGVVTASYSPGGRLQQDLNLTWYDRNFDINDMGYMQRGSLRELQTITHIHTRQFPATSALSAAYWRINSRLRTNDYGDRVPATLELGRYWRFRKPSGIYLYYFGQTSGIDDRITRGNGLAKMPPRHELGVQYQLDLSRRFNFLAEGFIQQEGLQETAWRFTLRPTYVVRDNLNLALELDYIDSPDWLIWRSAASRLATHERRQFYALFKLGWYPAPKHELRIKAQWLALRARVLQGYAIGTGASLVPDAAPIDDLSIGQIGLQIRYRYELQPLSDLYIVYSRGGVDSRDSYAEGMGSLFADAFDQKTASVVLVKLRYRF